MGDDTAFNYAKVRDIAFGQSLRVFRLRRGLNQAKFAAIVGLERSVLDAIERGYPAPVDLERDLEWVGKVWEELG